MARPGLIRRGLCARNGDVRHDVVDPLLEECPCRFKICRTRYFFEHCYDPVSSARLCGLKDISSSHDRIQKNKIR